MRNVEQIVALGVPAKLAVVVKTLIDQGDLDNVDYALFATRHNLALIETLFLYAQDRSPLDLLAEFTGEPRQTFVSLFTKKPSANPLSADLALFVIQLLVQEFYSDEN